MPLTIEQIEALNGISAKLRNSMNADTPKLPVLCYALDSSFLSEPDYKLLTAADFSIINTCNPSYFVAIVVVFIRNFYEKGSGDNYWKCTPSLLKSRVRFLDLLDQNPECQQLGFCNYFLPQKGSNIDNWVRSQCWILKVHDGNGRTSRMLKSNAAVKRIFDELFGDVSWEDVLTGQIDDKINSMELSPCYFPQNTIPEYVHYLFQNHRKTYLMSLLAMSMDKDDPCLENSPSWLKKIWGTAYSDMRKSSRDLPSMMAYWKIVVNGNFRDLILSYRIKHFNNVYLKQESIDKELDPQKECVSLSDLLKNGFDVHQDLILVGKTENGGIRSLSIPPLSKDAAIFRSSDSGVEERRLLTAYGCVSYAPNNRKIYIVSTKPSNCLSITYDGTEIVLDNIGRIYGDYMCYSAQLPSTQHPSLSPLVVNGARIMDLIERPCVNLLNSNRNVMIEYDNRRIYVVAGNTVRVYVEGSARVEPEPQHVEVLPARVVEYEIPLENINKIHTITVYRRNNNVKSREVHFICIPDDWKSRCVQLTDEEMYESAKKNQVEYCYNTAEHGVLKITVPIDKTYTFWIPKKGAGERVSTRHLTSLIELEGFSKISAYSNCPIQMEIRKDGKLVQTPEKLSSITVNRIAKIINKLPRLARKQSVVITFNNRPVLSVQI